MKQTLLVRHGESVANTGARTENYKTLPLSEKGKEQAQELATTITVIPELIVVSSYARAQETAQPFIEKHNEVPVEVWGVHEFTYLDPNTYDGTTREERNEAILDYWKNAPIDWQAGDKAESFTSFVYRVKYFLTQVQSRPEKEIVIFTHGIFIYTLQNYMQTMHEDGEDTLDIEKIKKLKDDYYEIVVQNGHFPIENASIYTITF